MDDAHHYETRGDIISLASSAGRIYRLFMNDVALCHGGTDGAASRTSFLSPIPHGPS